jgi:hypothetical protein
MARNISASPLTTLHWLEACRKLALVPRNYADRNRHCLFLVTLPAPPLITRILSVIKYVKKERELHRHVYWKTEFSQLQTSFQTAEKTSDCFAKAQQEHLKMF